MLPKEIVSRAVHFKRPSRLPAVMHALGVSDTAGVAIGAGGYAQLPREGEDQWGCVWGHTDVPNMGQVIGNPLVDIRGLDRHPMPDYTDDSRYVDTEASLDQADSDGKYVLGGIFMVLFERMYTLHGFENTLMDLYADRPAMEDLADRIVDVHVTFVREVARRFPGRLDGWHTTDDWGTQQAAFVSFDLWMDFFFPRYKRIFDAMHDAGCDVWVHSCGKVNEIVEGFIQAGVNVMNLQQPRALGIEEMGERYGGRIAFETLADIQATLPTGDPARVDDDAEALMTRWASAEGGLVLSDYGDDRALGIPNETVKPYRYEAFSRWSEKVYGEPLPALPAAAEARG